nr:probable apyrase 6 [Tanacetum cinerariifolium]
SFGSKEPVDPCSPKGYKHSLTIGNITPISFVKTNEQLSIPQASGNFSECRSASLTLLQKGKDECAYDQCYIGSTFIPKLQGNFLATENFFHTSKFFGLSPKTFLSELMVAGKQFCEEDWSKLKTKYPTFNDEDLHHYCFSSAYIVALLHDSLGIALDDKRIGYANQVNDIPLDWALGAFISQIMSDQDELKATSSSSHQIKNFLKTWRAKGQAKKIWEGDSTAELQRGQAIDGISILLSERLALVGNLSKQNPPSMNIYLDGNDSKLSSWNISFR